MASLETFRSELRALATLALSIPLRLTLPRERFDPAAPHPTPVVFVHGFLGDPTNFFVLHRFLATRGIRNFASFSYGPCLNYPRLALEARRAIEAVSHASGTPRVDVVSHSFGGIVARYIVETGDRLLVRRLVTLGSPCLTRRTAPHELAIFAANDPLVPLPAPARGPHGRVLIIPECGHFALLDHPRVLAAVARFLAAPATTEVGTPSGAPGPRTARFNRAA